MKKTVASIAIFLAIAAAIAFFANFVPVNGHFYSKNVETLDLSGQSAPEIRKLSGFPYLREVDLRGTGLTAEDYAAIRQANPTCSILWDLPYQGQYYSMDTTVIKVTSLNKSDVDMLEYLPMLAQVDASECSDYDALMELQARRPQCAVAYSVPLGGKAWDCSETALELTDADAKELLQKLKYLPHVQKVHLAGKLPATEDITKLLETYPDVVFSCNIWGQRLVLGLHTTRLDLSGMPLTLKEVRSILPLFPKLEEAEMLECGLTDAEMLQLAKEYPDCFFLWEMAIGEAAVRTDAAILDISGHPVDDVSQIEELLPLFPKLQKVIMSDCGVSNEDMDALNKRHDDIRFIWTVKIGDMYVRTDASFFAPVVTGNRVFTQNMTDLKYCTDIVAVDIGHMNVTTCEWAAYMPNLKYLIIADTGISDITPLANHEKLVFVEMFLTLVRDYSPLLSCPNLEDLNLCYTYGGSEDIRQMTWLKRLWWDGNYAAVQGLAEALPNTETNFHSGSSTGGTWRLGQRYKEQRDILGMPYFFG